MRLTRKDVFVLSTAMGVLLELMVAHSIKDQTILFMPILIVIALSLESKTG
jgi:flagellar biosynthesis protein FliQ